MFFILHLRGSVEQIYYLYTSYFSYYNEFDKSQNKQHKTEKILQVFIILHNIDCFKRTCLSLSTLVKNENGEEGGAFLIIR